MKKQKCTKEHKNIKKHEDQVPKGSSIDYYSWDYTLSDAECDFLIQDCSKGEVEEAKIMSSPFKTYPETRITDLVWVERTKLIHRAMVNFMLEANQNYFKYDITNSEQIQFGTYQDGGHYIWHKDDSMGDKDSVRKLTVVILLSDPDSFEGGELEVFNGDNSIYPFIKRGSIICFNCFDWHRVTPVTKGTRHTLVQWSSGPRFR